ncbi:hypothetical protein SAMN05216389_1381, partial [Oceanobacillus limi]
MKKIILVILLLVLVACSEETVNLEGEAVNYEELQGKVEDKESELKQLDQKIESANSELNDILKATNERKD